MSRPATISDQHILEAARAVFLERGFTATTAEVARRAAVAEGSIFKRFKTKAELFHAAMQPDLEPRWLDALDQPEPEIRPFLIQIGLEAIAYLRRVMPLQMMSWSNPPPGSCFDPATVNPPALRARQRLAEYFTAESRRGRLRAHDPEILARVFMGSLSNYVFFEMVLRDREEAPLDAETYVRGLVNLLAIGFEPATAPARSENKWTE